jgi:hypothetical protein
MKIATVLRSAYYKSSSATVAASAAAAGLSRTLIAGLRDAFPCDQEHNSSVGAGVPLIWYSLYLLCKPSSAGDNVENIRSTGVAAGAARLAIEQIPHLLACDAVPTAPCISVEIARPAAAAGDQASTEIWQVAPIWAINCASALKEACGSFPAGAMLVVDAGGIEALAAELRRTREDVLGQVSC